ncbi:amidohydrolase family protein [Rhodococcus sp. B10]|uniref:amidohydrolase family protein n=1 Tax=Rhodococcus sp. B10 TaxID=2695876 RepID=UPI00142FACE2|nr:Atrazine chlorohydrolase [Rhodococcus sp. B10]
MPDISRRAAILSGVAASLGAAATLAGCADAKASNTGSFLVRRTSSVLTMDPARGELTDADIRVDDGRITEIGTGLSAEGADVVDASGCIALPGLVDTHWHMWNSLARGFGQTSKGGFAPSMASISGLFSPEDSGLGVRLALAEAVNGGITTVHNWAHNVISPAHAEAEFEAMHSSGVRGRFAYGYPQALGAAEPMNLTHLREFAGSLPDGLVSLGICARGPDRSEDAVWQQEWDTARSAGLPITTHMASNAEAAALGGVEKLDARGGLGPDVQLVHLTAASPADLDAIARAQSPVSISPWTELQVGYGLPPIAAMQAAGVPIGLSVDNTVLSGSADMFGVMKLTADLPGGMDAKQGVVADATVLDWATAGGARSLGLGDVAGVLAEGRPADLVLVQSDSINTAPVYDATTLAVRAANPSNVSFVMIDGVVHKRDHRLVRVDVDGLLAEAQDAMASIRGRAGI